MIVKTLMLPLSLFLLNLKGAGVTNAHCEDSCPGGVVYISLICPLIQTYRAISRKVVGKMCTRQSRKVIWDIINTSDFVAVESIFVVFLISAELR